MSETTVVCDKCGKRVPKMRFCGECTAPLPAMSTDSTSQQISTPVQVSSDSGATENVSGQQVNADTAPNDTVTPPPTLTAPSTVLDAANSNEGDGSESTPSSSHAEAAQSNLSVPEQSEKTGGQLGSLSKDTDVEDSTHKPVNKILTASGDDVPTRNVSSEETNKKVVCVGGSY